MSSSPSISRRAIAPSAVANRRATVRYRCAGGNKGRVFLATCSRSAEATVADLSRGGIGLVMSQGLEPGTLLRIEVDKVPYVDLVAHVSHVKQLDSGEWRHGCEWTHGLTDEEWHALRGLKDAGSAR